MIHGALVLGIKDYFGKMGFKSATLGLSGGIDSAVTLVLAAEALGPENMHVLLLPSQYSSDHSVNDSIKLAENLGVAYDIIPIEALFNEYRESLQKLFTGTARRSYRREYPGQDQGHPAHGPFQQIRKYPFKYQQQK